MRHPESQFPRTIRRSRPRSGMERRREPHDWPTLLLKLSQGLQMGIAACNGHGSEGRSHSIKPLMMEGLQALEHLQQIFPMMEDQCEKSERRAIAIEAALAEARAELAGTQTDERRARHEARHDALTSLPNRRHFIERLEHVVLRTRASNAGLAVFYLDLDGFKSINDLHGHGVGDELLKIVATRMNRHVRREDLISRLGGDEFACLRQGDSNGGQLREWAEKLYHLVSEPMKIGDHRLMVTPSIGISQYPGDGTTAAELLRNADASMYRAKRSKSKVDFFAVSFEEAVPCQLLLPDF